MHTVPHTNWAHWSNASFRCALICSLFCKWPFGMIENFDFYAGVQAEMGKGKMDVLAWAQMYKRGWKILLLHEARMETLVLMLGPDAKVRR